MKEKISVFVICILSNFTIYSQFNPNSTGNYNDDRAYWSHYYDSVKAYNLSHGIETKIPGLTAFLRWRDYWDLYMPSSGNYNEANEIFRQNLDQLKKIHFSNYNENNQTNTLIVNPVIWSELGPKNVTKIETQDDNDIWRDSHVNNDGTNPPYDFNNGTLKSGAHVAKIDRLFQHPTQPNIIYACAGGLDNGGGGLFVSNDYGHNWNNLGTDKIPYPLIMTFGIKPFGTLPNPSTEYLFVGLSSGAVYRSVDNGANWIECNYYGNNQYPYWNSNPLVANSLPYDGSSMNDLGGVKERNTDLKFAKQNSASGEYSRLIVSRNGGVFFSDNFYTTLVPSGNTINNGIIWQNMTDGIGDNFNLIKNSIPIYDGSTVDRDFHFTDFESIEKNGNNYYLIHFQVKELNISGGALGNIRQYVCYSTDFGITWSFLGGQFSLNSPHGEMTSAIDVYGNSNFTPGNIESLKLNPTFIYIASTTLGGVVQNSYSLKRFNIDLGVWEDFSNYGGFYNQGMITQAHGFAIDPNNEENWWFLTNSIHKKKSGALEIPAYLYSFYHHADARDLLVLPQGKLLVATDGGVYQAPIGPNDHILNATSEGLNAAQSYNVGLAQKPPFYVASGFWHAGFQIYNPEQDKWHYGVLQDGKIGDVFFLNNERFSLSNATYNISIVKNYNELATQFAGGIVSSSENIYGRSYGIMRAGNDYLSYNNDDFTASGSSLINLGLSYPLYGATPRVVPNEPDLVAVHAYQSTGQFIYIYNGCNTVTPVPNLIRTIDIQNVYESLGGDVDANLGSYEFDARKNGRMWIVLKRNPIWGSDFQGARIAEYDPISGYVDLSFPTDDDFNNTDFFPNWLNITDIKQDRQTGVLYLATTNGVYYLDRENSIWRKFSVNIPLFNTNLGIRHCTGEIFASGTYRGIWQTYLIRNESTTTQEWNITQSQTWTGRMNLFCTLVIEPGVTLTIKDELVVYGFQKIIVKPGGRLIVDGGKITTECGEYWSGIEVWGNSSQFQNSLNQGHLIVRNGGIIEFAQNAVLVGKEGDASKGGGLVQAANSTFRNNINCVKYLPYNFYSLATGNEILNKGRFINCEFLWDDNFIGEDVHAGLDLNHVNGVIITGCTIRDDRTTVTNPHERPFGIISLDAGYKVIGRNTGPLNSPIHHIYDETNMDVSYFKNLREGIYAMNALSQNSITVDHAKFEDMVYGIHVSSVDNAILTRNKFNFTFSHPSDISVMHEMAISKSTGFTIEGNIFNKQPANSIVEGVLVYNSGFDDNKIYRNVYENLYTANYANGENTNDQNGIFQPSGLEFLCNNYSLSDKYDQYVYTFPNINGNGQGVKLKQGTSTVPAGNIFSLMNPGQNKAHFHSTDSDNTIYYGYHPDPLQQLTVPGDGVGYVPVYVIDEEEYCGSNFNTVIPNGGILINSPVQLQIINELQQINFDYNTKSNELSNLLTPGDSEYLHELVGNLTAQNKTIVKNELLSYSPYLSESLLIELGEKTPSVFPPNWYKLVIEANVEVAQNKTFINYLNNKPVPLAPGLVNNIIEYALIHSTERGTKMDELTDLNSRKSTILNFLISNELSDSTEINWSIYKDFIIQRDDIICRSQLADMYLGKRETAQCDAKLDDIDVHINEYMVDEVKQEMMDYSTFKKYILNIIDSSSLIMGLTQEQIDQLNYVADNFRGKSSVQAKNLLCYLTGQCEDLIVEYASGNKSAQEFNIEDNNTFGKNLEINPNPNNGQFEVKVPNECLILNVYVNDIQGRKVDFQRESLENNRLKLDIDEAFSGLYLITIECEDTTYTSRIIIK